MHAVKRGMGDVMAESYRLQISALEGYGTPVARVDPHGVVTYVNQAAQQLLGVTADERIDLRTLFLDDMQYARVSTQLHQRLEGALSNYDATFRRPHDSAGMAEIPIRIYAFPDLDDAGNVTGSVAIIHDRRKESMQAEIHAAIEKSASNDALFGAVAAQLRRLFQFDVFQVTAISRSRKHLRSLYSTDPNAATLYPFRWWPMPMFVEEELDNLSTRVIDIDALYSQPRWAEMAETDAATRNFLASGVKTVLNMPVTEGGRLVAIVSLHACRADTFDHFQHEELLALPIGQAVITALYRERRGENEAVFALLREAAANANNVKRVAEELVQSLVGQGWHHVSVFQSDEAHNRMRLVCQANGQGHPPLPDGFMLPRLDSNGLPANAVAEAAVCNGLVEEFSSRARGPFAQEGSAPVGSELVLPIRGQRERWVLNVESTQGGSFAAEEIRFLELLTGEAGAVLHRSSMFELQVAVLSSINDAVIETDDRGVIRWSNAAAKQMLGLPVRHDVPLQFGELIADERMRDTLAQADCLDHRELNLRTTEGKLVPVLLSISSLPEHLGGRVHVASDFTYQKEVQRLGELKEVFRHAALEGRIPLSLATIWLRQYAQQNPAVRDMIEKVLAQLGRADLPLERLLRLFSQESAPPAQPYCDLARAVSTTLSELPDMAQQSILAEIGGGALPVSIDFTDLQFCVESMISFGLRTQPQSKALHVATDVTASHARCHVWGDWEADFDGVAGVGPSERWRRKSLCDLTLGDSVIERLVQRAGGEYRRSFGPALSFEIALPLFV